MTLLLHRGAEFQQFIWNGLIRCSEDVDERAGLGFVVVGEKGDGKAGGAGSACPVSGREKVSVTLVPNCRREENR